MRNGALPTVTLASLEPPRKGWKLLGIRHGAATPVLRGRHRPDGCPKHVRRHLAEEFTEVPPAHESGGNRTHNLWIKSPLLCQLSYAPARWHREGPRVFPPVSLRVNGRRSPCPG